MGNIDYVVAGTNVGHVGLMDANSKRINRAEGQRPEKTDPRVQKSSEAKRETVTPTYSVQGEIVEPHENERYWGIILGHYKEVERNRKGRLLNILA